MKFEDQLKKVIASDCNEINENEFVEGIHKRRFHNYKRKQQLVQTVFAGVLIVMFGLITVESLEQPSNNFESVAENTQIFCAE